MPDRRNWLHAEQSDDEALAETLFARLVAELPPIEPRSGFVAHAVQVAWRSRVRRRHARLAAVFAIGAGTLGLIYELSAFAFALLVSATVAASHGLVWLLTSASDAVQWWSLAARIGNTVSDAVADPATAAAVAAVGTIALLAIYALRHLFNAEFQPREARRIRI